MYMQENTCIEDNSTKTVFKFHLAVRIDLVEVVYHLKVFHFLSKLYGKGVTPGEPFLLLNMIDIESLHLLHHHHLLYNFCYNFFSYHGKFQIIVL